MRRIGGHDRGVESLVVSPDGAHLISTDGDVVMRWDLVGGASAVLCEPIGTRLDISPDGAWLALGDDAGGLWRVAMTGDDRLLADGGEDFEDGVGLQAIAISPDGKRIALGGGSEHIEIRDAVSGELVWTGRILKYPYAVRWRGDDLIIGSWDGAIYPVDAAAIASGESDIDYYGPQHGSASGPIFDLAWAGDRLAIAWAQPGRIALWDFASETYAASIERDAGVHALAVSPDGTRLVAGGNDQALRLYDARTLEELGSFTLLPPSLKQPPRGTEVRCFYPASGPAAVRALVYHPDGERVIAGLEDGGIVEVTRSELEARGGVIDVLELKRTIKRIDAELERHERIKDVLQRGTSDTPGEALAAFDELEQVAPDIASQILGELERMVRAEIGEPEPAPKRTTAKKKKPAPKQKPTSKPKPKPKPKAKPKQKPKPKQNKTSASQKAKRGAAKKRPKSRR